MTNGPGPVPMPPVKRLVAAGVTVFAGSDNIRDAWSPYGNGDMLERAMLIGYRQGLLADADLELAFDLANGAAARVLGRAGHAMKSARPPTSSRCRPHRLPRRSRRIRRGSS